MREPIDHQEAVDEDAALRQYTFNVGDFTRDLAVVGVGGLRCRRKKSSTPKLGSIVIPQEESHGYSISIISVARAARVLSCRHDYYGCCRSSDRNSCDAHFFYRLQVEPCLCCAPWRGWGLSWLARFSSVRPKFCRD
jgi:hypothetical protein